MVNKVKLQLLVNSFVVLISLVVFIDFVLPGKVFIDEIIQIKPERQYYYNAARNSHNSYKLFTNKHEFFVSEAFSKIGKQNQEIKYTISRLFKKVNSYSLVNTKNKNIYSLRILSGLVIPLLVFIVLVISYIYNKKLSILIFVIKVLAVVNLVYLFS